MIKRRLLLAALAFIVVAWSATADALTRRLPFDQKAFEEAQASGRSVLVEFYTTWCPVCKVQRPFLTKLSSHVRMAIAARRPSKALHLRDEMREHARLHETGVLSKPEYEACKARILAEHAPSGASAS